MRWIPPTEHEQEKDDYRADTSQFSCVLFSSQCMHATISQNLADLNANAVLHAMWQKSSALIRALIEKCGSLVISGFDCFSRAFQWCAVRLLISSKN